MEATTISPDSANGVFNLGVPSGNIQSGPGSALPFSTILQSQQQSKHAGHASFAANTELLKNQLHTANGHDGLGLDQLSLDGHQRPAAAPWLVLGLHGESTRGLETSPMSEDESALLTAIPEIQAVPFESNKIVTSGILSGELAQATAVSLEQGKSAQSTFDLSNVSGNSQANLSRQSSGGGASNRPISFDTDFGSTPTDYFETQDSLSTVKLEQLQTAKSLSDQLGVNAKTSDMTSAIQESSSIKFSTAVSDELAGVGERVANTDLLNARNSVSHSSEDTGNLIAQNTRAVSALTDAVALNSDAEPLALKDVANTIDGKLLPLSGGVPINAGSLPTTGSMQQGELSVGRDANSASLALGLSSDIQRTGDINIETADLVSMHNKPVEISSASASLGASIVDPSNSQLRGVVPAQGKRIGVAERVDVSTAVDASEGYHWLSDTSEAMPEPVGESTQTSLLEGLDSATVTTTGNSAASVTNNVRNDTAPAESFAAAKRAADVAGGPASNATNSTEQSNSANLEIDTPVQDAQWSQALAYRVQFMAQEGIQRAQVQLNPAELGPMEITVDVADDVAKVQITAENAATREAVEQAVPRLREMMALSGFNDTGVDLSQGTDDFNESSAFAESLNGSDTGAGGDRASRDGEKSAETQPNANIKTLGSNEVPQRGSDGRLSFYV